MSRSPQNPLTALAFLFLSLHIIKTIAFGMRFCIINCENSQAWQPLTFSDMFYEGLVRDRDRDKWEVCRIAHGDKLPDDIDAFNGIVITGSHFNCRDRDTLPWFEDLCCIIKRAAASGTPKIYGGCFGCQVIAAALGGEVDYNPSERFILKAEDVQIDQEAFVSCLKPSSPLSVPLLKLLASHGDCVRQLPESSILLAKSATCDNEMFITGSLLNILACQSHPEFDLKYAIMDRIFPSVTSRNRISPDEAELSLQTFSQYDGKDAKYMLSLISHFLHTGSCS